MERVLLHICCGPCSIIPVKNLREKGLDVHGYFYNPNIHPYTEFKKRRDTLKNYAEEVELSLTLNENYHLEDFLRGVVNKENERCRYCYYMRLNETARFAKDNDFQCFTTTLLVSPWQKHEIIRETGEEIAQKYGLKFYYEDFRPGYREGVAISKEKAMYRQPYCGCIYSEKERYYKPIGG